MTLGQIAFTAYLTARRALSLLVPSPVPRFRHGATSPLPDGVTLIGFPSSQPTEHVYGKTYSPDVQARLTRHGRSLSAMP